MRPSALTAKCPRTGSPQPRRKAVFGRVSLTEARLKNRENRLKRPSQLKAVNKRRRVLQFAKSRTRTSIKRGRIDARRRRLLE